MRLSSIAVIAVVVLAVGQTAFADCPKTGRYAVKIDSAPTGAPVYIGDKTCQVGVTPYIGKLNRGTYSIIIETPGYETATKDFKVAALRKTQELFIRSSRRRSAEDRRPRRCRSEGRRRRDRVARRRGQGPGADRDHDGRRSPPAPHHEGRLRDVRAVVLGHRQQHADDHAVAQGDRQAEIRHGRRRRDVPDAEVFIDGNKHPDNTPAIIQNVIEGVHVIEVRKEPAQPWKQSINVTANQQTKVRAELQATLNGGVGVVRVLADADGARAFIDGTDMGPTPVDIKDVKAGDHIVSVKVGNSPGEDKHVTVAPGSSQIVKFEGQALGGEQGLIKVVSMVPDAEVFIDGASVGKVPVEKRVSAGEHPVVVRLEGMKQFEQKVRVDPGQSVTVQAQLKQTGRLRVLSTPANAQVVINGIPVGKTPLDTDVETGETVVRIEAPGFQAFEQTLTIEGGKTQTLSRELPVQGMTEAEWRAEQRGLTSWGARVLPRGRSTTDFSVGYPYYLEGRINVGAGSIQQRFKFDANITVRTLFARTELGIGGRMQVADQDPFSAALFTNVFWGATLFDNSQRSGLTWDWGLLASLTALDAVTITGRVYADVWSDRECPKEKAAGTGTGAGDVFDGSPIGVCSDYYNGTMSSTEKATVEKLTGWKSADDVFGRDSGIRFVASVIAEIATRQHYNFFLILEGSPTERALFSNYFTGTAIGNDDLDFYFKLGFSYKF